MKYHDRTAIFRFLWVGLLALLLGTVSSRVVQGTAFSQPDMIQLKTNLPANPNQAAALYETDVIEVKFKESLVMRLRDGLPSSQSGGMDPRAADALVRLSAGGTWLPSHTLPEARLDELRQAGEARSGRSLPDLNSYMRLKLPPGMDVVTAVQLFAGLESVEAAYLIPRPVPVADVQDYSTSASPFVGRLSTNPYQRYLDPAPDGIDARWAWTSVYGNGKTIGICDVEYDYNEKHEDLPAVTYVGDPKDPPYSDDHGTAVMGILAGVDNDWGVKGIAYRANIYFAAAKTTTSGYDVGNGVLECMNVLNQGDVILIEQQTGGPNYDASSGSQFGLVPVEWYKPWYDDIVTAVANGMIVVEAGGNGSQDLDSSDYSTGNGGHHPFMSGNDSGAIIVGAGKSPYWGANARRAHDFSSYGSTVDLQGWGDSLVTTGYGDLYPGGSSPDPDQRNVWYRRSFGGTSGASPIVAAAAAIVQGNYKAKHGSVASPAQVKQILQDTGTAQAGSKNIGPLPNLKAAMQSIWGVTNTTVAAPTISPASGAYVMPMQVTIAYGSASQNSGNTHLRYTLDGSEPTLDSFIFLPDQGDQIYLNYGATVKAKAFQSDISTGQVNSSDTTSVTYVSSTPKVETPVITPGGGTYNQPHQVTITTSTSGATIRYRTDGRSPSFFYPGTEYTGPITLQPGEYHIKARGYKDGYYKSDAADSGDIVVQEITLPAPTIYPSSGGYAGSVTVYVGSTVLGADIRYTTDGSDPTQSSPQFSEPIVFTQTGTLKARVYLSGYTPSNVVTANYTITQQVATPVISPPSGSTGTDSLQVSITTATPGATIRYTTNGAEPTDYSTEYTGPFSLGVGEYTVKAKATLDGASPSATASADFVVYSGNLAQVEDPVIDPNGGNHTGAVTVTLTTATQGASIYYILDSSNEPNVLYTGPVVLQPRGDTYSFRAKAKKTGMADSNISATSFTVFDPSLTGQIEVPDVTPPGGTYTDTVQVTVDGHTNPPFTVRQVYVTTDGQDPVPNSNATNHSSPYSFSLSTSATVKAIATQLGWTDSDVVTNEYVLICDTPRIDPPGGTFTDTVTVTLSTSTPNSTVHYLTGEHPPNGVGIDYTAPFTLPLGTTTVWANCTRNGFFTSITAAEVFVVNPEPVAPTILTQPISQTVDAGTDVTFTLAVTGTPYPAIRWQRDGVDIAGETEEDLVIAGAQPGNAGAYRAVVENSAGVVTSTVASLTVNATATPTPTSTPTPTATVTPGGPTATPTPTPTSTPTPTATVTPGGPTFTPTPSPTLTPTATPGGPTSTPAPSPTATSTPTPTPTSTPGAPGSDTDVAINEVYYRGDASQDWVEIVNTGSGVVDISDWWLCARFQYGRINTLTLLSGNDYILGPGEKLVVQAHADLDNAASDLGLYTVNDFANPSAMVDFVQWGTDQDVGRSDVAAAKGIWRELSPGVYDFVPSASSGQSTAWKGTNSGGGLLTHSEDWENGTPSPGGSGGSSMSIFLPLVTKP